MIHLFVIQQKSVFMGLFLFVTGAIIFPLHICAEETKQKDPACVNITKRDPFWPVGFVSKKLRKISDPKKEGPKGPIDWDGAMNNVKINGVSKKGTESFVMINTDTKKIGDTVSVDYKGHRYEWIVESITSAGSENSVKLKPSKVE